VLAGFAVVIAALCSLWRAVADDASAPSGAKPDLARAALHAAVEKNLGYCRDWLAAKDWKSLRQSAEGVGVLVSVLAGQGDDPWRASVAGMAAKVPALRKAADQEDAEMCRKLLNQLAAANKELAAVKLTTGRPGKKALEKPEALRPVMLVLDGTYSDAKVALAAGDADEAKSMARVLSELGRMVSNHRTDAAWRSAAGAMARAAAELADAKETDAKAIRQHLRGVYEKCQACHDGQR
jgi:hypothetical protein